MDPITLSFYGVICGLLGLAGPSLGRPALRLFIGAAVGILAAGVLPYLRASLGV